MALNKTIQNKGLTEELEQNKRLQDTLSKMGNIPCDAPQGNYIIVSQSVANMLDEIIEEDKKKWR